MRKLSRSGAAWMEAGLGADFTMGFFTGSPVRGPDFPGFLVW